MTRAQKKAVALLTGWGWDGAAPVGRHYVAAYLVNGSGAVLSWCAGALVAYGEREDGRYVSPMCQKHRR